MNRPAPKSITETWTAVEGPRRCGKCGHDHWGWLSDVRNFAPQWTWCDDGACDCIGLRAVPTEPTGEGS